MIVRSQSQIPEGGASQYRRVSGLRCPRRGPKRILTPFFFTLGHFGLTLNPSCSPSSRALRIARANATSWSASRHWCRGNFLCLSFFHALLDRCGVRSCLSIGTLRSIRANDSSKSIVAVSSLKVVLRRVDVAESSASKQSGAAQAGGSMLDAEAVAPGVVPVTGTTPSSSSTARLASCPPAQRAEDDAPPQQEGAFSYSSSCSELDSSSSSSWSSYS